MNSDEMKAIATQAFISYGVAENARDSVGNVAEAIGILLKVLIDHKHITKAEAATVLSAPAFSFITAEDLDED